jgi:hypothetical protein
MRRNLWIALLAFACVHAKPLPTPAELAAQHHSAVLDHHVIDLSLPSMGGRCVAQIFPLDNGKCATFSLEPGAASGVDGYVTCGQTASLCGHTLACDCSKPLPADPCHNREMRGSGYEGNAPDGSHVVTIAAPPKDGVCVLAVLIERGSQPIEAMRSFALIGEPIPMAPSQKCTCDDFD